MFICLFVCLLLASMESFQASRLASKEHYNALKNKKEELERIIEEKEAEMRRIKIEEAVSYIACIRIGFIRNSEV